MRRRIISSSSLVKCLTVSVSYHFLGNNQMLMFSKTAGHSCWWRWSVYWEAGWSWAAYCGDCWEHFRHHWQFWVCPGGGWQCRGFSSDCWGNSWSCPDYSPGLNPNVFLSHIFTQICQMFSSISCLLICPHSPAGVQREACQQNHCKPWHLKNKHVKDTEDQKYIN